jgi:AraC family transcriptional regulator
MMRISKILLIKQIKHIIHEFVYKPPKSNKKIFSNYLSKKLKNAYDYSYLAQRFSKTEGKTIEKYLMFIKIERVKELILADEMTFSE